jgi:putative ABC transport system substrate-binding protein
MKKKALSILAFALIASTLGACNKAGVKKIGILQFGSFDALTKAKDGFVSALEEKGFKDGGNIEITLQNPQADSSSNQQMAGTLAASMDLVYGVATPCATALKNAVDANGRDIPVVFSAVTDPVGAKLVASLEAPGANVTGMSDLGPIEDELKLLNSFSGVDKVATLITASESNSIYQEDIAKKVIAAQGWAETPKQITNASEIPAAVSSIPADVDALWIPTDDTIAANISMIKSANEARTNPLIVLACDVGMIEGSVIGMGVDYTELGKQAGAKAAEILNGADPASIKVETADKSVLSINKTWATSLGLTIPEAILSTPGAQVI